MSLDTAALAAAALLSLIALIHLALAAGVRRGEWVWSGKQPRLLSPELRLRSAVFGVLLLMSGWILLEAAGLMSIGLIPQRYLQSATFAVMAFLGTYFIYTISWGSRWERMLFAPITLAGAVVAGWLTFA